jgi:hypothetical protein
MLAISLQPSRLLLGSCTESCVSVVAQGIFHVPITLDDVSAVCLSLLYDGLIEYHTKSRTTVSERCTGFRRVVSLAVTLLELECRSYVLHCCVCCLPPIRTQDPLKSALAASFIAPPPSPIVSSVSSPGAGPRSVSGLPACRSVVVQRRACGHLSAHLSACIAPLCLTSS